MEEIQLVKEYIKLGAKFQRLVKIRYQYLDKSFQRTEREAYVQPVDWLIGRKGIHILGWDLVRNDWRRFALENIIEVSLTDMKWSKKIKTKLAK